MTNAYSDLDFGARIDSAGSPILRTDSDAINQSIRTILTTSPGERIMAPDFGANLRSCVFAPLDRFTEIGIREMIIHAIEKWEPRVQLISIRVQADEEASAYDISIDYVIKASSTQGRLDFSIASKYN